MCFGSVLKFVPANDNLKGETKQTATCEISQINELVVPLLQNGNALTVQLEQMI